MNFDAILAAIDDQIAKLEQARSMLAGGPALVLKKPVGRPKKVAATPLAKTTTAPAKRVMSEEARARIAAAQKKRWAATKKAAK
jgi:hypothetical protein